MASKRKNEAKGPHKESAPTAMARVSYGNGGGLLVEFTITKDDEDPTQVSAWMAGSSNSTINYPINPKSNAYRAGNAPVVKLEDEVRFASNSFRNIGPSKQTVWIWIVVTTDAGGAYEFKVKGTLSDLASDTNMTGRRRN